MEQTSIKRRVLKTVWRILLVLIGSVITGVGIGFLLQPHRLLTGGVTGTSLLISYFLPINAGVLVAIANIPLFIIAWKKIDLNFCIYSIIGTLSLAGVMMFFGHSDFKSPVSEPLLAALFGGMLSGGGTGLVIRARGSHGGTDIISIILRKKFYVSIGTVNFYLNLIIVGALTVKFGVELGLLTIFSQYISSRALDRVVTGLNTAKAITIVSDHAEEIANYILKNMYRGVTFLDGHGGYGGSPKKVIWCVVTTSQMTSIKGAMKKIDPKAFMAITDSEEIVGKGFYSHPF